MRTLRIAGLLGAGLVLLAACGSSSTESSDATTASTEATTTATDAGSTATANPATTTTAGPGRCLTANLTAVLGPASPGAGNLYQPLTLTNKGSSPCVIEGFPGVSVLDAVGTQIGPAASRATTTPTTPVTLAPGAQASTVLHTLNGPLNGQACLAKGTSIRVYPPDDLNPIVVPGTFEICGNVFDVTSMAAGTGE